MRWFRTENGLVARQLGRSDIELKEPLKEFVRLVNNGTSNLNGEIWIVRNERVVTISTNGSLTHDNASDVSTTVILPEWARPKNTHDNCYFYNEVRAGTIRASTDGSLVWFYRNETGGVNQDSTIIGACITYTVFD